MSIITLIGILLMVASSIYVGVTSFEMEEHEMDLNWEQYHACKKLINVVKWIGVVGFTITLFSLI